MEIEFIWLQSKYATCTLSMWPDGSESQSNMWTADEKQKAKKMDISGLNGIQTIDYSRLPAGGCGSITPTERSSVLTLRFGISPED